MNASGVGSNLGVGVDGEGQQGAQVARVLLGRRQQLAARHRHLLLQLLPPLLLVRSNHTALKAGVFGKLCEKVALEFGVAHLYVRLHWLTNPWHDRSTEILVEPSWCRRVTVRTGDGEAAH